MRDYELICIAGKNNIAVDILQFLLTEKKISPHQIVITCNKTEDGVNKWQRSLRYFASKHAVIDSEDALVCRDGGVREVALEEIYPVKKLIFLSLEYDKIIKPNLFISKELYNIHFSLLPKYKGMYTSVMPLLNNEQRSGVTFHKIDEGIDTGNIILQQSFKLDKNDTARTLYMKCMEYGVKVVKEALDIILDSQYPLKGTPQSPYNSSYYSRSALDYNHLLINLNQTALSIHNQIRAFNFREYQLARIYGKNVSYSEITNIPSRKSPGAIVWENDDRMILSSIDYDIVIYYDQFAQVLSMCQTGNMEGLKKVKYLSIYVNQQNEKGWTPLMVATYYNHYEIVRLLISEGADIRITNRNGTTLLMYAKDAYLRYADSKLFEVFIELGADMYQEDYNGKSLIDYCKVQAISRIGNIKIY